MSNRRRPSSPTPKDSSPEASIWIKTERRIDGSGFGVTLEIDEDTALTLTPATALAYAESLLTIVQRAEYDAAVNKQLTGLVSDPLAAAQLVQDLRRDRPPVTNLTDPLSFEGIVSHRTGRPLINVLMNGEPVGHWTLKDARGHAIGVMETVVAADLDADYLRVLTSMVGLDRERAHQVIGDLGKHRETFRFAV